MTTAYLLHTIIWAAVYAFIIVVTAHIAAQAFREYFNPFIKALRHALRTHRPKHLQADSPRDKQRAD